MTAVRCTVCGRPFVGYHGKEPRCGYHLPEFSSRTRSGAFQDFKGTPRERDNARERERHHARQARSVPVRTPRTARIRVITTPTNYKVVAISLYSEDITLLKRLVAEAKTRGVRKANQSALIRYALRLIDVAKLPEAMP